MSSPFDGPGPLQTILAGSVAERIAKIKIGDCGTNRDAIAIHEAGHAVLFWLHEWPCTAAIYESGNGNLLSGLTCLAAEAGAADPEKPTGTVMSDRRAAVRAAALLVLQSGQPLTWRNMRRLIRANQVEVEVKLRAYWMVVRVLAMNLSAAGRLSARGIEAICETAAARFHAPGIDRQDLQRGSGPTGAVDGRDPNDRASAGLTSLQANSAAIA